MKVIAFLPAKGTSSRVESKNLKLLDGKPLFLHTLEKLIECDFIDEVYLDTESDEVIDLASETNCKILKRDPNLASNTTDGNKLFLNEVNHIEADIYIQILGTSPFIEKETIRIGVEAIKNNEFDSAILIRRERLYTWNEKGPNYDIENIPNSFDLGDTIIETMGLYIVKRETALSTQRRIGNKPYLLDATPLEAIDVNWPEDFDLANLIAAGKREKERKLLDNIKSHLTSAMLSDIMDDFGLNGVLQGFKLNIPEKKIFGKAKTLKLRALEDGEDFRGIYNALYSYNTIIPNDIIIVENEISEFAYFGELNANLAIRSGASAAIIGGVTRDTAEVEKLGFPVFSKGSNCKDVRKRATMESYNKTIEVEGIKVSPNDLIFGDNDGIIIIPKMHEDKILKRAFEVIKTESNILVDIANGVGVDQLTKEYGFF
jgi:CMP-N-acetylneuraminic acid synthetase/regulator of RNase E activity RraA